MAEKQQKHVEALLKAYGHDEPGFLYLCQTLNDMPFNDLQSPDVLSSTVRKWLCGQFESFDRSELPPALIVAALRLLGVLCVSLKQDKKTEDADLSERVETWLARVWAVATRKNERVDLGPCRGRAGAQLVIDIMSTGQPAAWMVAAVHKVLRLFSSEQQQQQQNDGKMESNDSRCAAYIGSADLLTKLKELATDCFKRIESAPAGSDATDKEKMKECIKWIERTPVYEEAKCFAAPAHVVNLSAGTAARIKATLQSLNEVLARTSNKEEEDGDKEEYDSDVDDPTGTLVWKRNFYIEGKNKQGVNSLLYKGTRLGAYPLRMVSEEQMRATSRLNLDALVEKANAHRMDYATLQSALQALMLYQHPESQVCVIRDWFTHALVACCREYPVHARRHLVLFPTLAPTLCEYSESLAKSKPRLFGQEDMHFFVSYIAQYMDDPACDFAKLNSLVETLQSRLDRPVESKDDKITTKINTSLWGERVIDYLFRSQHSNPDGARCNSAQRKTDEYAFKCMRGGTMRIVRVLGLVEQIVTSYFLDCFPRIPEKSAYGGDESDARDKMCALLALVSHPLSFPRILADLAEVFQDEDGKKDEESDMRFLTPDFFARKSQDRSLKHGFDCDKKTAEKEENRQKMRDVTKLVTSNLKMLVGSTETAVSWISWLDDMLFSARTLCKLKKEKRGACEIPRRTREFAIIFKEALRSLCAGNLFGHRQTIRPPVLDICSPERTVQKKSGKSEKKSKSMALIFYHRPNGSESTLFMPNSKKYDAAQSLLKYWRKVEAAALLLTRIEDTYKDSMAVEAKSNDELMLLPTTWQFAVRGKFEVPDLYESASAASAAADVTDSDSDSNSESDPDGDDAELDAEKSEHEKKRERRREILEDRPSSRRQSHKKKSNKKSKHESDGDDDDDAHESRKHKRTKRESPVQRDSEAASKSKDKSKTKSKDKEPKTKNKKTKDTEAESDVNNKEAKSKAKDEAEAKKVQAAVVAETQDMDLADDLGETQTKSKLSGRHLDTEKKSNDSNSNKQHEDHAPDSGKNKDPEKKSKNPGSGKRQEEDPEKKSKNPEKSSSDQGAADKENDPEKSSSDQGADKNTDAEKDVVASNVRDMERKIDAPAGKEDEKDKGGKEEKKEVKRNRKGGEETSELNAKEEEDNGDKLSSKKRKRKALKGRPKNGDSKKKNNNTKTEEYDEKSGFIGPDDVIKPDDVAIGDLSSAVHTAFTHMSPSHLRGDNDDAEEF